MRFSLLTLVAFCASAAGPLDKFDIPAKMKQYKVPGVSVAIADGGRIVWSQGFGEREAGSGKPVTVDTLFQAASISKPVAATGMLRLVEKKKLDLDEDVNRKLKSWRLPDNEFTTHQKVTLRRIASHGAGLTVHGFPGYEAGVPLPTLADILDGRKPPANTAAVRVDMAPGSQWRYSGGGTTLMQLLIQDVTGKSFPDFMRDMVLKPAQMKQSSYQQPLPGNRGSFAASGHDREGKPVKGKWHVYPEMAAAGLWTTPADLCRWALEIQRAYDGKSKKLLSQAIARQMLTRQTGDFGLGPGLQGSGDALRFGHGGSNAGFRSQLVANLKGQAVAVMTNGDLGGKLAGEIVDLVIAEYKWAPAR
ncbi:MAG: beta-lactamase family protein [Bryobacteraceae bacterium]|nr:beta-lactamase family protein [Bryobacteraceae bacterium]